MVEHHLDMVGVGGSIPLVPTSLGSYRKTLKRHDMIRTDVLNFNLNEDNVVWQQCEKKEP